MKLSLRKANALQNAIQEQIKTIEMTVSVSINEFQEFLRFLEICEDGSQNQLLDT